MLKPPKTMFQDTVKLISSIDNGDTSNSNLDVYGENKPITEININNCRFILRTVYSGSNNDRQVVSNATVVFMNGYTEPFYDFSDKNQGDKLVFNGKEYTITSINRDIEPFTSLVYQYKVGVI